MDAIGGSGRTRRAASAGIGGLDWLWQLIRGRVVQFVGGPARTRVVVLFGCVLALSSAQIATVGAVAPTMEQALHIGNTKIGLLNTVTLLVSAFAVLPVGLFVDKAKRIPMLSISIVLWSVTTMLGALAGSYGTLLFSRVLLGLVSATAGPAIASLTGDYFPSGERARVYGYILTGEIAGTAVGFVLCGTIASAISWQAAFWVLAIPGLFLARSLWRTVPEPLRGGQSRLERGAADLVPGGAAVSGTAAGADGDRDPARGSAPSDEQDLAYRMAREKGYKPNPRLILYRNPERMSLPNAIRYIMRIPTNVLLIVSSSLGYFFFSGLETFAVVFVRGHFQVGQGTATLVLGVLVLGAIVGTLLSGPLTDLLTRMGHISARVWVPAICNIAAGIVLIPGILTGNLAFALPFCFAGTALISAANPPLDAARLDIMPPGLWGRAESARTFLRSIAQALAPLLFGGVSDLISGFEPQRAPIGTHTGFVSTATGSGLQITFLIMLTSLIAAGWFLWRARPTYPIDVATAAASTHSGQPDADGGGGSTPGAAGGGGPGSGDGGPRSGGGPGAGNGRQAADPLGLAGRRPTAASEQPTAMPGSEQPTTVPGSEQPTAMPGSEQPTAVPRSEQRTAVRGSEEPTAVPGSEQPTTVSRDRSEDATASSPEGEPLVRRRRPQPEWLRDGDRHDHDDGGADDTLVRPRRPSGDR